MSTQRLLWNVLVFGAAFYLVDQRGWDPITLLFALIVAIKC